MLDKLIDYILNSEQFKAALNVPALLQLLETDEVNFVDTTTNRIPIPYLLIYDMNRQYQPSKRYFGGYTSYETLGITIRVLGGDVSTARRRVSALNLETREAITNLLTNVTGTDLTETSADGNSYDKITRVEFLGGTSANVSGSDNDRNNGYSGESILKIGVTIDHTTKNRAVIS